MNERERSEHRQRLMALREGIVGEVENLRKSSLSQSPKERSGDLSGYSIHLADAATDSYENEFTIGLASREGDLLKDIDDALEKMESGSYGVCESCGQDIGGSRLKAMPYARLCLRCKELQEKGCSH